MVTGNGLAGRSIYLKGSDMETRYTKETGVTVKHVPQIGWAHYDANDRKVGPWYQTKTELLTDHEAYLIRAGWMKQGV